MVREAVDALGPSTSNTQVRDWILERYPETNINTIQCQIIICSVNHNSRVHFPENNKPRRCDTRYDFLYRPERGRIELYNPSRHGQWEIAKLDDGRLVVQLVDENTPVLTDPDTSEVQLLPREVEGSCFAAEDHLREYLARNLDAIEEGLRLHIDEGGTDGVEYQTPIGRIDLLAVDRYDRFVVVELKVGRGPDSASGQILRYKNWVRLHLAGAQPVRGIIIAQHISDKIKYAVMSDPDVSLKEYELHLTLHDVRSVMPEELT